MSFSKRDGSVSAVRDLISVPRVSLFLIGHREEERLTVYNISELQKKSGTLLASPSQKVGRGGKGRLGTSPGGASSIKADAISVVEDIVL